MLAETPSSLELQLEGPSVDFVNVNTNSVMGFQPELPSFGNEELVEEGSQSQTHGDDDSH